MMGRQKEHWENIYKKRDHKQLGWYQASADISLALLSSINATPDNALLDVGCGASVLVDALIAKGYTRITLLDLSDEALSSVKTRLAENGDLPHYLSADISQSIYFKGLFDIWHDRAVFHFLTERRARKAYMENLERSLSASGHAIIGTFSVHGPGKCSGLDVVQYDEQKMRGELPEALELKHSVINTHTMPGGAEQEYMYFVIARKNHP